MFNSISVGLSAILLLLKRPWFTACKIPVDDVKDYEVFAIYICWAMSKDNCVFF